MRFAVVGAGPRSKIALLAPEIDPAVTIVAVADSTDLGRGRAREIFGQDVEILESHHDLIDRTESIDAVLIATPDHTHADIACDLLTAGIPVYLEKPLATDIASADRVLATAQATGTKLYVGHNMRNMAVIRLMRQIIERGEIGQVKAIWCRHFVGHGGDYYFKDWHAEQRFTNSLLLQKGVHDIDAIHMLAGGYTEQVSAAGSLAVYGAVQSRSDNSGKTMPDWFSMLNWPPLEQTGLNPVIDVEDISMMTMTLDNGVLASYQQCHFTPDYWRNYTVIGTQGRLENFGDGDGGVVRVWNKRHAYQEHGDTEYVIEGDANGHEDADKITMAEFVSLVRHNKEPSTTPVAARQAVAAAAMAAFSLRNGSIPCQIPKLGHHIKGPSGMDQSGGPAAPPKENLP